MKKVLYTVIVITVVISACTSRKYSHYRYLKSERKTPTAVKKNRMVLPVALKQKKTMLPVQPDTIANYILSTSIPSLIQTQGSQPQLTDTPLITTLPGKINTHAKIGFWSGAAAFAATASGVWWAPLFAVALVLGLVAFVFGIIALRQIKKTGQRGKAKAEFALFVGIAAVVGLVLGAMLFYAVQSGTLLRGMNITF